MWLSARGLALGRVSAQEALGVCMTWPCCWQHWSRGHLILFWRRSLSLMRLLLCPVSWAGESEGRAKSRLARLLSRNSPLEQPGWSPVSTHPETQTDEASVGLCVVRVGHTSPGPRLLSYGLLSRSVETRWSHHQAGVTQNYVGNLGLPSPFPESSRGHQVEHTRLPAHWLWSLLPTAFPSNLPATLWARPTDGAGCVGAVHLLMLLNSVNLRNLSSAHPVGSQLFRLRVLGLPMLHRSAQAQGCLC